MENPSEEQIKENRDQIMRGVAAVVAMNDLQPVDYRTVVLRPMPAAIGMPPEARIGDRVKEARNQLGLTFEGLSRITKAYDKSDSKGLSGTSISRYEAGESMPGARELRLLCDALEVPAQWVLYGTIPNAGKTETQQELIRALAAFVHEQQQDIHLGGSARLSQVAEHDERRRRAELLSSTTKTQSP